MLWESVAGVVAGILLAYAVLLFLLWLYARRHPETVTLKEALRMLPDLLRLIRRLAEDRTLALGIRVRLVLLLAYLLSPIDLVPDFIPVIGYADDAIIVAMVLRSVLRRAGPDALGRHWPGTPAGLEIVLKAAGRPGTPGTAGAA
ncbi:DUF1232 domain-containing protein [Arthrobacter sp. CDRTa11]|uniref:YkvA family protein n=1 Tax=Arthrobacter sp. CDRTa11 TaxID=2651199 RepID=UPI002265994A|nr:YkvA family protein [Arthrobacter sp. CDRTa11]UZX04805.1 DUF1232 domain-containing protein [Arthrobacter sp. CDRTa11]